MANTKTALITPQFSLVRQADINNDGKAVAYPQYTTVKYTAYFCDIKTKEKKTQNRSYRKVVKNKFVEPNQIIGRLYFPKGHSQRSQSWFHKFVDVVYDSWKSNGALGWTEANNPVRVVQFVLKPDVSPDMWLKIAADFAQSNMESVRSITNYLLDSIRDGFISVVNKVVSQVKQVIAKKQQLTNSQSQKVGTVSTNSKPTPIVSTPEDAVPTLTTPTPQQSVTQTSTTYTETDYAFVLKYKPRAVKRVCKDLKFKVVDNKTLVEDLISSQTPPEVVRGVFTKRKSSK